MAKKIYIDGRVSPNGRNGHTHMDNAIDLAKALQSILSTVPSLAANPYTFSNGLTGTTTTGTSVVMGGLMTQNTTLNGAGNYNLNFDNFKYITFDTESFLSEAYSSNNLRTYSLSTDEEATLKVESDAFVFTSTDSSNITNTYELPSQQEVNESDMMVMDSNGKANFTQYERDVFADTVSTFGNTSTAIFVVPFNTGEWECARVTALVTGATFGDKFSVEITDAAGVTISNNVELAVVTVNAGVATVSTEALVFTHNGAPMNYFVKCTSDSIAGTDFTTAKFVVTFRKVF